MKTARRGLVKSITVYDASTAKNYAITHDIFTMGAGVLDISAAFFATDRPAGSAASPVAVYNSTTKKASLNFAATGGTNVIWGTGGTGGFNVIWGTSSPFSSGSNQTESLSLAIKGDL